MRTCDRCGTEIDPAQTYTELRYSVQNSKLILGFKLSTFFICNKCDESFAEWLEAEW